MPEVISTTQFLQLVALGSVSWLACGLLLVQFKGLPSKQGALKMVALGGLSTGIGAFLFTTADFFQTGNFRDAVTFAALSVGWPALASGVARWTFLTLSKPNAL